MSTSTMSEKSSLAVSLASLPETDRARILDGFSREECEALLYDWRVWARPEQLPPTGDWRGWLLMAGRGSGKTRAGVEWVLDPDILLPDDRIALIAPTTADVRDVVVEGESGILACAPPWNRPDYEPSKRRLTWKNGAMATTYSADEPDRLRGPQHTRAWCDEIAAWRYGPETWSNLMFGLRLGDDPKWVATTTPKPVRLVRELLDQKNVVLTKMTTYDNAANLAPAFMDEIIGKYEGTRLGRQELMAELLEDVPGALWTRTQIDELRVKEEPDMVRIVVAVDPAVTSGEEADLTGIIVAGRGTDGQGYVLEDLTCRKSPDAWAQDVVAAYHRWKADRVVAEVNNGGDLVETILRTVSGNVSYKAVHASRGKRVRAEPIAALYEQGKVHHVGTFPDLEDQMTMYVPDQYDGSPDRVDAMVWAFTELILENKRSRFAVVGA
jgi:predicted phage terminase large subunit-like protein